MNMNQFTQKTISALERAQSLAIEYQHMQVEQEHLMLALIEDEKELIPQLLAKCGLSVPAVANPSVIPVLRAVSSYPRPFEPCSYEVSQHHLQRLAVPLIHSKEKERQHNQDHDHGRHRGVARLPQKKIQRQADTDRRAETQDLPPGQIQEQLALYPGQIPGNVGI